MDPTKVAWVNSFYGPDNSGIGVCVRYGAVGIGTTVFGLSLDSAKGSSNRTGVIGISVSAYLIVDFSDWLALYANLGGGGHFATYGTANKATEAHRSYGFMSTGMGFQLLVASHLMLGIGYGISFDTGNSTTNRSAAYDPIHSIVTQVGYRL